MSCRNLFGRIHMTVKKNKRDTRDEVKLAWDALGADGQKVSPLRRV
jgi:hypothetical protein